MPRASKDIAKRLRFDHRPRPDAFRRWYFVVGLAAVLLGVGAWLGLAGTVGERQYLPGPVSPAHATFGDRCAACHADFASTPNDKCHACHNPRVHSEFEPAAPPCRDCHIEHRTDDLLVTLSGAACIDCHAALRTTREPAIAVAIATFEDHPELTPLREGQRDPAALRFNHQLHLSSKDVNEKLVCETCHVADADGRYMQEIVFETHCERCHKLEVSAVPAPIGQVKAPHEAPPTVRDVLIDRLLALGAKQHERIFIGNELVLIPGREARDAVDNSKNLMAFQQRFVEMFEAGLYKPFVDQPPLLKSNKDSCFLCHVQGEGVDPADFPIVVEPKIPARWLARGEFSHRRHDKLPCETCHPAVRESAATAEVNLPKKDVCLQCHVTGASQSAGAECLLCHLYHDTTKDHAKRLKEAPAVTLDDLLGRGH